VPVRLPLFPLGMVLVPGLLLPLHVFEQRYRAMVHDLLELPETERLFGVVAIRSGREVGADGVTALHEIGCTARLRRAEPHPDGRFDLVSTGVERFLLRDLEHDRPYLTGVVDLLGDEVGPAEEASVLASAVGAAYTDHLRALAAAGGEQAEQSELPGDPRVLSHLLTAALRLDLEDRQALLAEPDAVSRLRAELALLRREARIMRTLRAVPAPELTRIPLSPN
jgi:Lon protease-like protein